jgi:hypothetical protein
MGIALQEERMAKDVIYLDGNGDQVFVSSGISSGVWMTMKQNKGGMHRVKSPNLPVRKTFAQAQEDLDAYAKRRGWGKLKREWRAVWQD